MSICLFTLTSTKRQLVFLAFSRSSTLYWRRLSAVMRVWSRSMVLIRTRETRNIAFSWRDLASPLRKTIRTISFPSSPFSHAKITWISKQAHLVPLPDCVTELTPTSYYTFMKRNAYRSVMVMYYLPNYQPSQITLVQYQRAAYAFKVESLDPSERRSKRKWCLAAWIVWTTALSARKKAAKKCPISSSRPPPRSNSTGSSCRRRAARASCVTSTGFSVETVEPFDVDTNVDPKGGFNERFGRVFELDRLARQFTTNVEMLLPKLRDEIEKRGPASSLCAGNGEAASSVPRDCEVLQDHEGDAEGRFGGGDARTEGNSRPDEPDHVRWPEIPAVAAAREYYSSVWADCDDANAGRNKETSREKVYMNPWSFDYVVNGHDNVIVLFYTSWCTECQDLLKDMEWCGGERWCVGADGEGDGVWRGGRAAGI